MNNTLRRIDLNLLVTLQALLEEQNVTRAAERLHLAQPTVSVQLARVPMRCANRWPRRWPPCSARWRRYRSSIPATPH